MYKLIKNSYPGWEFSSTHITEVYAMLLGCVCSGCKRTKSELDEMYAADPKLTYYVLQGGGEEDYIASREEALPDDWQTMPVEDKMNLLLGTCCGAEYDLEVTTKPPTTIFGCVLDCPSVYYYCE